MLFFTGFSVKNKNNQNYDEIVFLFFVLKTRSKNPIISGAYHHLDYMKNLFR